MSEVTQRRLATIIAAAGNGVSPSGSVLDNFVLS